MDRIKITFAFFFLVVFNCHALENLIKTIGSLKPRISDIKEYTRLRRMRSKMCSRLAGQKFFRSTTKAARRPEPVQSLKSVNHEAKGSVAKGQIPYDFSCFSYIATGPFSLMLMARLVALVKCYTVDSALKGRVRLLTSV